MQPFLRFFFICLVVLNPLFLRAQPLVDSFTISNVSGCTPLFTSFQDNSSGGGGIGTYTCNWIYIHLGSGIGPETLGSGSFVIGNFPDTGIYEIIETVTSGTDTASDTQNVYAYQPSISLTTTHISTDTLLSCPGLSVTFENTSTNIGCADNQFSWFITNNTTGFTPPALMTTGTAPLSYTFTTPGYYSIELEESPTYCDCSGIFYYDTLIKIDSTPTACFTVSNDTLCGPGSVETFNSGCSVSAVNYLWSFGGGGTSTLANPTHVYTATGIYTNELTVYSAAHCASSAAYSDNVYVENFNPEFALIGSLPICTIPLTYVTFEDHTYGSDAWRWYDNTGATLGTGNIFGLSAYSGVYTITDSVWSTTTGCSGKSTHTYSLYPTPVVTITATPDYRCAPSLTATFNATVIDTTGINKLIWSFGDPSSGHYDTAYSDSMHVYGSTGTFMYKLYVKDNAGCSTSDSNTLFVGHPRFNITTQYDSGCAPFVFSYSTSMSPPVGYTINQVRFGDGSTYIPPADTLSGMHTYTAGGAYTVSVTYTLPDSAGGCSYTAYRYLLVGSVHPTITATATPDSVCPNTWVYFNAVCPNCTSFFWNLDGKTSTSFNDSNQYPASYPTNNYPISIIAIGDDNGCTDTFPNLRIHVLPPAIGMSATVADCANDSVINFSSAGSTHATGYHWSFGDGTSSNLADPTHIYTIPPIGGSYNVVLVDTGGAAHHCVNRDSLSVDIYPIIDSFSADDTLVCRYVTVNFTGPMPQITGLDSLDIWTFSSSATADSTDTVRGGSVMESHSFSDTGAYTVRLIIVNKYGCIDSLVKPGYIRVIGPIGGFSAGPLTTGCTPLLVNFHDNNSVLAGDSIISRLWNFSYPLPVAGVSAAWVSGTGLDTFETFPEGNFTVVLKDSDINHCTSFDSVHIHSEKPNAHFTASPLISCTGVPITFTDTNTHCNYTWSFGDGTMGTAGPVVSHSYSANGTYSVSISLTTTPSTYLPTGCHDTLTDGVTVNIQYLSVGFDLFDSVAICPPLYCFANVSGIQPGITYYWDINHSPPDTVTESFRHNFTVAGYYAITLIDSNAAGCKDSVTKSVQVFGPGGIVTATPDSGCAPLTVNLHFTDTNGTAVVPNFTWVTGDDFVYYALDTPGVVHTYIDAGSFQPYVVISSSGCDVQINLTDSVYVFSKPVVTVDHPGIICYGTDTTLIAGGGVPSDTYSWLPAYGLSCTSCESVLAGPLVNTNYTVTLASIHGCIDTAITTVRVDSQLNIYIVGNDSVCLGKCDTLYALGVNGNYQWYPDTALSAATHDTVIACPTSSHNYTIVATDERECTDTAYFNLKVNPLPLITVSPSFAYVCRGDSTQLFASGADSGGTYVWSPDQFISNNNIFNPFVYDTADFIYKIVATTKYGCVDSDIAEKITVFDSAYTTVSNDTAVCQGKTVQLLATSTSGSMATYLWSPATGLNATDIPDPLATLDSTQTYQVFIQENICFSATRYVTVYVVPNPEILLPASSTIIAGSSVQLAATVGNAADVTSWAWAPAATLSCDTCYNPVATPTITTTYTVTGTTPLGCTSENSVQLNIICVEASQVFVPNTFTPNGDGVNDRFYLSGKGLGLIKRMSIYNRWGEEVFSATDINANDPGAGWDGTYKGIVLEPGVFVYVFDLLCETGVPFTLKGDISIVK